MKYIIAIDIGGTTFRTGIFTDTCKKIKISNKDKIRYYNKKIDVKRAIVLQIKNILKDQKIKDKDLIGIGIASPGPINSNKGIILDTPNLKIFKNYHIVSDFKNEFNIDTFIENDANLFSLGEWYLNHKNSNVMIGTTLGTGLGLGLVLDGELFKGGNDNAMEYGLSPFKWGICEKNTSIRFIRRRALKFYGEEISPVIIEKYYFQGDKKAIQIYNEFGQNLGIVFSHLINMFDPNIISIGGGLSKAFNCFKDSMYKEIKNHCLTFNKNKTLIIPSEFSEKSTMVGACLLVLRNNNIKD